MCKNISGVVDVECDVAPIDKLFNESEEIRLYRIVQESLNNIIKHSDASAASVKIKRAQSRIWIAIEDNGKGFEVENVKLKIGGLGLVGLRERAELLNGEFSIESKIGKGTTIRVEIRLS
jgi:signal transduction histidine kinase